MNGWNNLKFKLLLGAMRISLIMDHFYGKRLPNERRTRFPFFCQQRNYHQNKTIVSCSNSPINDRGGISMKKVNPIEVERQKARILNGLEAAFHHVSLKEGQTLMAEAVAEIEDYEKKIYGVEPPTVQSTLQELYDFNQATEITTEEGQSITLEVYQDLIYQYIEQLADLLGTELKG